MDPRVSSHIVYSQVHTMPDVTYYIKHTAATEVHECYPVLIFGAKYNNGTRYELIPETGIGTAIWEELRKAASGEIAYFKHSGIDPLDKLPPMQIIACPSEVLFISDGEPGICTRGRMQLFVPPMPAAAWFRIARDVVSAWTAIS